MTSGEKIAFTSSTWVTLISLIVTGVATNLMLIYSLSGDLQKRIDDLDDKWQQRLLVVTQDIKADIKHVETKIPPDWFRQMVEDNTKNIDELEDEFTRDFIRKSELEQILESRGE